MRRLTKPSAQTVRGMAEEKGFAMGTECAKEAFVRKRMHCRAVPGIKVFGDGEEDVFPERRQKPSRSSHANVRPPPKTVIRTQPKREEIFLKKPFSSSGALL